MFFDFYHLRQQPFGVTPDPAFLYPSRTHCEALDSLTEGILGGRGFLALIAEPGMGKTTLLYQVLEGLRGRARAAFLFQTQCNSREFFQYLLSELGVDSTGMELVAMHNKLNEMLFAEMLAGKRFVLIVDEAQNLDDSVLETIRLLSNFETTHTKLLQIVLAGQPQLEAKLAQPQLAQLLQRLTVLSRLEPLSPLETACYIEHRLKVAGYSGEPIFLSESVELIAQKSQGIPRNINKICFNALSEAYSQGRQTITPEIVRKVAGKLDVQPVAQPAPAVSSVGRAFPQARPRLTYPQLAEFRRGRRVFWAAALATMLLLGGLAASISRRDLAVQAIFEEFSKYLRKFEKADSAPQTSSGDVKAAEKDRGHKSYAKAEGIQPRESNRDNSNVTDIQTSNAENHARVVVTLDSTVNYDAARIASPDRIYFDLYKARLSPSLKHRTAHIENGLLTSIRAAQDGERVRLVLRVDGARDYLAHMESNPYRLVIDLYAQGISPANTATTEPSSPNLETDKPKTNVTFPPRPAPELNHDSPSSLTRELGLKISRIVIDPGHGGQQDTGAVGPHGLLEKDLCLDVALRVGHLIEQNLSGAEVIFTRKDDTYTPLENRTAIANRANADLFISIHANSSPEHGARGVETYYLNLATSQESMGVATRENALSQSSLHDLQDLIKGIARNEKIEESKELATDIQNALSQKLQFVSGNEMNRGVKKAPFIVLIGAEMPSVLSEISFVSNASDERLLRNGDHRQLIAEGLYGGIAAYLNSLNSLSYNKQKLVTDVHSGTLFGSGTTTAAAGGRPK